MTLADRLRERVDLMNFWNDSREIGGAHRYNSGDHQYMIPLALSKKPRNCLILNNTALIQLASKWRRRTRTYPKNNKKISSPINLLPKQDSVILSAYHKVAAGDGFLNADFPDEIDSLNFLRKDLWRHLIAEHLQFATCHD